MEKETWCHGLPSNFQPVLGEKLCLQPPMLLSLWKHPKVFLGRFYPAGSWSRHPCSAKQRLKLTFANESSTWSRHRKGHSKVTHLLRFLGDCTGVLGSTGSYVYNVFGKWQIHPESSCAETWPFPPQLIGRDEIAPARRTMKLIWGINTVEALNIFPDHLSLLLINMGSVLKGGCLFLTKW